MSCRFNFGETRVSGSYVQVSEVRLFDAAGMQLTVSGARNPGGLSPPGEGPGMAVDGRTSTKWLDKLKTPSVLDILIENPSAGVVGAFTSTLIRPACSHNCTLNESRTHTPMHTAYKWANKSSGPVCYRSPLLRALHLERLSRTRSRLVGDVVQR